MTILLNPNNRLFVLARQGQRQPSAVVAIVDTFVTLVVAVISGQMVGRLAIGLIFPNAESVTSPLIEGARERLTFTTGFLPIYLCLWAWVHSRLLWAERSSPS